MSLISFIIPAHNEEQLLGSTLAALRDAVKGWRDDEIEVLVVNDASTDRTAAIALAHGARVIPAQCRQIAGSRNAGGREAAGEYLIFVDADTQVTPTAVAAAVASMKNGAVGGGCAFRFDGKIPLYARVMVPISMGLYHLAGLAAGCFIFCTREAFLKVGGFDETLYAAEEVVLSRALRRLGRFVILREKVITSGRKVRTYSGLEVLAILLKIAIAGPKGVRRKEGLDIWYGERRPDP